MVIPRSPLFSAVSEISTPDPYRIQFRLKEARPRAFMMGAFASGWNVIVRKKTLDDNEGNLRQVMAYPGTGPFRHVSRKDKEVWIMEKNPNYWNKGLPYLDRLEVYHLPPFSPELGSALLTGKIDYGRLLDPVTWRKVKENPNMTAVEFNQSVIQAVWVNNKRKPLDNPKVRRAMHLALDKHVLVDVVKDVAPMMVGGFVYPFHELSTPADELVKRIGYQKDATAAVQEAKKLMNEAGHGAGLKNLDFLVRDAASYKLWAVAVQSMLKEHLNIETNLRTVQISQWFEEAAKGNFDLGISAIVSSIMDPSDYFSAWYGKDGPQNYSQWTNEQFHALARQIETELDEGKRKTMVRQAEAMLEQDPPLLPVAYEKIYDGYYNYVKGQNPAKFFGIYDVVRWDVVWRPDLTRPAPAARDGRPAPARPDLRAQVLPPAARLRPSDALRGVARHLHRAADPSRRPPRRHVRHGGVRQADPGDRARLMADLGLSDPLPVQYLRWLRDIATGSLGKSFFRGDLVSDLILHRGPLSAEIGLLSVLIPGSLACRWGW